MAQDLVVKLLLNTGAFSSDLKTAKGQIQSFKTDLGRAGDVAKTFGANFGSIGKYLGKAGPWGLAAAAVAGVGTAFRDSGIYADQFAEFSAGANGALTSLKFNLANFSWDNFITDAIEAAKVARNVANELDGLNTVLGANLPVKNVAYDRYVTALTKAQDNGYTKEQRLAFLEEAQKYGDAYLASLTEETDTVEQKAVQIFRGSLGDLWDTFAKLSDEEQKKLMTQGASGQWGFNDALQSAIEERDRLVKKHNNDARQVSTWNARPDMLQTYNDMKAAEEYVKLLEKLIALENRSEKKPEIIKNFQDIAELFLRGGSITDIGGTVEELMEKSRASISKEISLTRKRINSGEGGSGGGNKKKTAEEIAREEREKALKSLEEYRKSMVLSLMEEKERELAIEKEKYDENIALAQKYGQDIVEITELYNQKVKAINQKYADKEEAAKQKLIDKIESHNKSAQDAATKAMKKYFDEATKLEDANKKLADAQSDLKYAKGQGPVTGLSVSSNILGDMNAYVSSFKNLKEAMAEAEDGGEQFLVVIQGIQTAINMVLSVVDTVNTIKSVIENITFAKQIAEQAELAAAEQAEVVAKAESVAASTAAAAAKTAEIVAVNTLASAYTELAAAEAMAANIAAAGVGGVATGAAEVAAMTAAILGAGATVGAFANGGIVGGSSFTGDRLTARVNSGEMILNRAQQGNLFRQINNGGSAGAVQFHISGTDLVGVLDNNNRKSRLTR